MTETTAASGLRSGGLLLLGVGESVEEEGVEAWRCWTFVSLKIERKGACEGLYY